MPKPALTLRQQIAKLEANNLTVLDDSKLARFLYDNNYYRLSGYWRYQQVDPTSGNNRFVDNASIESIELTYAFDASLRNILLEGIADVEVTLRSRLAYQVATHLQDECGYLDLSTYQAETGRKPDGREYEYRVELIAALARDLEQSKERFVRAHQDRGMRIPIWVSVETTSFGTLSKMFRLLADRDVRYAVSKSFGFPNPEFGDSVFHSLSTLRNICAHHGRVWNRVPARAIPVMNALKTERDREIYSRTPWSWLVMLAFLTDGVRRDTSFSTTLWGHIKAYPEMQEGLKYPHDR